MIETRGNGRPELGFYYPGQYWHDADWIKNLVLFFDGLAMLIPKYMPDEASFDDYPIVAALKEHEMFKVVRPEEAVDAAETERLGKALFDIIDSGGLDHLVRENHQDAMSTHFGSLSMSRLGYDGDREIAEVILQELKRRGLARDSEDGVSIPMQRTVRALILVLLAQILKGKAEGSRLCPVTDRWDLVYALEEILSAPVVPSPSVGDLVSFDLGVVGVDLGSVPMDEILDFRRQNYAAHRDYRQSMLRFARELSVMEPEDRDAALERRQEELDAKARHLRRINWVAWRKRATFGLAATGAALTYDAQNPWPATLAALVAVLNAWPDGGQEAGVYSYVMSAGDKWRV